MYDFLLVFYGEFMPMWNRCRVISSCSQQNRNTPKNKQKEVQVAGYAY